MVISIAQNSKNLDHFEVFEAGKKVADELKYCDAYKLAIKLAHKYEESTVVNKGRILYNHVVNDDQNLEDDEFYT